MEQKKSNKKGLIIALVALAVVLVAALSIYLVTRPATVENMKSVTAQVVHLDGSTKDFPLKTAKEFLGDALVEGNVVVDNQGDFGLYILTADGETVDEAKEQWWCITKGGEAMEVGAGSQPIADGEHYEITFTVGY